MSSIGNVSSSSQLVAVRPITANDLKNVKPGNFISSSPLPSASLTGTGSTAANPLLASPSDQQADAAKAEDKQQEAFARMRVELQTKNSRASA